MPGAKKKVGSPSKTYHQRASDIQAELRTVLKSQFKAMFVAIINDFVDIFIEAIRNDGANESGKIIDLASLNTLTQINDLATSPHLESQFAKQSKFGELVLGHKAKAQSRSTLPGLSS